MDWLVDHLSHFVAPGEYSHPGYLLSAFSVGAAFLVVRGQPSLRSVAGKLFGREAWLGRSARADYRIMLGNEFLARIPNAAAFVALVNFLNSQTLAVLAPHGPLFSAVSMGTSAGVYTVYTLLLMDFGSYVAHRLQHTSAFLWRFHMVHHSADTLNPLTVFRQHPVDMLQYTLIRGVIAGVGSGLFPLVLPATNDIVRLGSVNVGLFLFYLTAGLRHSHVPVEFPKRLRPIFFSPHMHQLHHSDAERHRSCNYGVVFAFWDRLFGSYIDEPITDEIRYGLGGKGDPFGHSVVKMYMEPLGLSVDGCYEWVRAAYRGLTGKGDQYPATARGGTPSWRDPTGSPS